MIDDIGEGLDVDAEIQLPNSRIFLTTRTAFQKSGTMLRKRIIT